MTSTIKFYVRRIVDSATIHTVEVHNPTPSKCERVLGGLLQRTDTDKYYVDDSEADKVRFSDNA